MICSQQVKNLQWIVQGHSFTSTARVLPLKCFDMILGGWLESCSPMLIHQSKKVMRFTHQGIRIQLQGLLQDSNQCAQIFVDMLLGLINQQNVTYCLQLKLANLAALSADEPQQICSINDVELDKIPKDLQQLLTFYSKLFQEPTTLPPQRQFIMQSS